MSDSGSFAKPLLLLVAFLGGYCALSFWLGKGPRLGLLAGVVLCLVPLAANIGFLLNAGSPYRRQNAFWALWAVACGLWSLGELMWVFGGLSANQGTLSQVGDFVLFMSVVPMVSAVSVRPHCRRLGEALRYGYIDLALLTAWSAFLYSFFVLAPGVVLENPHAYNRNYFELTLAVNLGLLILLISQWRQASGDWRRLYGHLSGALALHAVGWLLILGAFARGAYFPGSVYDLPLVASFAWLGYAGLQAHRLSPAPEEVAGHSADSQWALRLSVVGVISLPALGCWAMLAPMAPAVQRVRVDLTLSGVLIGMLLLLLRQRRVDAYRRALLADKQLSLDKTSRLQAQLVLTEKLASLGELAADAAREINDPLTAIFGYTDLLLAQPETTESARVASRKIQVQAHRTGALVDNLLRFAQQVSAEKCLLDMNALLSSAVELQRSHLSDRKVAVRLDLGPDLPAIRGNAKLLLQVFYEIINNAADAMDPSGGGELTIQTRLQRGDVAVEFGDSGPGVERPDLVFDPFYTTKAVGKGTGLGLSMCYGIVNEHGGLITCRNRVEGGAVFRVELPAVILPLPLRNLLYSAVRET